VPATDPREERVAAPARRFRVLQMCAVDFTARQFLLPLAEALRDAGYEVHFACTPGLYFEEIGRRGFVMHANPIARSMNVFSHLKSLWSTYRLLRRDRFDVVHVHTPIAALIGRIAACLARVPVRIYTAHGFYFHERSRPTARRLHIALEKLGARCGDFIMTVSREDEQTAIRVGIECQERIETVYNGIDLERFDPARVAADERAEIRRRLGIEAGAPVIGIVGRMVREKGFFEFFDAAALIATEFPEARFLIVGDTLPSDYDAAKAELLEHMRRLGLEGKTVFAGMVEDTVPLLACMDVFCLPSYREGMPVSLLEAMAMRLPCIATNIRGCREEIVERESGWLVPVRESRPIADRVVALLKDPVGARQTGDAARRRVSEHFDQRKVLAHQLEIYRRLTVHLLDQ
jgi:glycosyltransferase involved in cell wall biosynthesis